MKTFFLTTFALIAFALNSILCRMALGGGEADAAGFTFVRLASGAAMLVVISYFAVSRHVNDFKSAIKRGNWFSAFFLLAYAICFSFAYLGLSAGTGALILFGSVQITMILYALFGGERPTALEWIGLIAAVCGLLYLVWPGLASPPAYSSALMAAAGAAWGFYTLRGKRSSAPLDDTTGNFIRSVPMIVLIAVPFAAQVRLSANGFLLATLSGAVASGIGYTAWYAALKHLTSTRAAVLQLSVPVITAALGIVILFETASMRLFIAGALVLGGILLVIFGRRR